MTITVPKVGTSGTTRANRGIAPSCKQPNPKSDKMSKKFIDELKAKPIDERVKSAMSVSEPRVLCVSVFDNAPVHMLDTIHTSAGIITIYKPRWDAATKKKVKLPLRILQVIDDYNHNMDYVDIRDHLSHEYNFDGGFWRDRKWWMPIFKELFKSSCDQGYVSYKRVCEMEEEARLVRVKAAEEKARSDFWEEVDSDDEDRVSVARREKEAVDKVPKGRSILPMTHLIFLEKIAEGFVIEAYNSTKKKDSDKMALDSYDLTRLERALAELRGDEAPSSGASGAGGRGTPGSATPGSAKGSATPGSSGRAGGQGVKRKLKAEVLDDGALAEHQLVGEEKHALIDGKDAVDRGFITESYRTKSMFCAYKFCKIAAENKDTKCGEASARVQAGRAKASTYCMHPDCRRGYHATCWSLAHRLLDQ